MGRTLWRRREVVSGGVALLLAGSSWRLLAQEKPDPEKGVTAPEDLMREHGILDRCLLVYEEGMRRLEMKQEVAPEMFAETAEVVRRFVEDYHEKNEETHVFPVFEKAGQHLELVRTLRRQHDAGRRVTAEILAIARSGKLAAVSAPCHAFIRMYRPHAAREDTVLFPALREILPPRKVEEMGDRMEESEQKVLGKDGFEHFRDRVAALEEKLGIADLARFTPS